MFEMLHKLRFGEHTHVDNLSDYPVTGWIFDKTGNYSIPFYVAGVVEVTSGALYLTLQILTRKTSPETIQTPVLDVKLKEKLAITTQSAHSSMLSIHGV